MKPYLTDYHINKIIDSGIVLIDTREKENLHIIEWLEKTKTPYKSEKLEYGDYALLLPKNEQYGLTCDMMIEFSVERKACLEEISGNLTEDRNRFEEELWRGKGKMAVVIENGSFDKIYKHDYKTQYNEKAFVATLLSFQRRYNIIFSFVEKEHSPKLIYALLKYGAREELK